MAAPPPPHPLAHLDPCPECGTTFLISPRHCTGEKEPAHEDWWYELCFKKIRPVDPNDECDYFDWCEELGKGKPGEIPYSIGRRCPGLGCQGWRQGRKVNLLCYFGLCKQCCVDAHFTVTGLPACFVKDHNPTRVARAQYAAAHPDAPVIDITPPQEAQERPAFRQRRVGAARRTALQSGPARRLVLSAPAARPAAPVPAAPAARPAAPAPATPAVARRPAAPVAPPGPAPAAPAISAASPPTGPPGPSAQQLVALQISERERLDTQNARKADAEEEKKTIEDEEEHELFILVAPYYPRFHPKDCPDLVERFHVDKESFQFFVWPKWDWVTGTPNTPRRDLLSAGGDLYYRSPGVKRAPGMPMRGIRRTLSSFSSDADEGASPAMQRFRSHGWSSSVPSTPSRASSRASSRSSTPYDFTPSSSALDLPLPSDDSFPNVLLDTSELGANAPAYTSLSGAAGYSLPTPTATPTTRRMYTPTSIARSASGSSNGTPMTPSAPLPALFPGLPHVPLMSDGPELDPEAPRGRYGWPLKYVIDMAIGFNAMRRRQNSGMAQSVAFMDVFGNFAKKWNSSTWSDNHRAWEAAESTDGEVERWIKLGRTGPGEWSKFMGKARS